MSRSAGGSANPAPGFRRRPDYSIAIAPIAGRVQVVFAGRTIADSVAALCLEEAALAPVVYVPRSDVVAACLEPGDRRSHCPYKGEASYWDLVVDGQRAANAAWSYEQPYDEMRRIGAHLAFYADRVALHIIETNSNPDGR